MGATGMWLRKPDTASTGDPLVLVVVEGSDRRTLVLDHFPFTSRPSHGPRPGNG